MSVNSSLSLSQEINKSYDSSNLNFSFNEKEEKEGDYSFCSEEKKRISKISLHLEEIKQIKEIINENQNIEDISTDEYEHEFDLEDNKRHNILPVKSSVNIRTQKSFSKFEIYFSFTFNKNEILISIESDVFNLNKNTIQNLTEDIIKKINNKKFVFKLNKINYILSLKDCEEESDEDFYSENYELIDYDKKKSCINYNFIKYPSDLLLKDIQNSKLSLICKNPLNIMIREM